MLCQPYYLLEENSKNKTIPAIIISVVLEPKKLCGLLLTILVFVLLVSCTIRSLALVLASTPPYLMACPAAELKKVSEGFGVLFIQA